MNFITSLDNITDIQKYILLLIGSIGLIFIFLSNKPSLLKFVITIGFSEGLFGLLGTSSMQFYKLFFVIIVLSLFLLNKSKYVVNRVYNSKSILTVFYIFSLFYFMTCFINESKLSDVIIYYASYLSFILLFVYLSYYRIDSNITKFLVKLISFQILFSVVKLFVIGRNEALVGTAGYTAGSVATIFPIIALIFLHRYYFATFSIKKNIWWLLGLLLIGVASNKRAIWFFFPVVLFALNYTVYELKRNNIKILGLAILSVIIVSLGVKINPSLNPSGQIWGEFDSEYASDYILNYTYNVESMEKTGLASGRVSGNVLMINKIADQSFLNSIIGSGPTGFHGSGVTSDFITDLGYATKQAITRASQFIIVEGLIGFVLFMLIFQKLLVMVKKTSYNYFIPIFLLLIMDMFFYQGLLITNRASMILLLFSAIPIFSDSKIRILPSKY